MQKAALSFVCLALCVAVTLASIPDDEFDFKACHTAPTDPIDCVEISARPDAHEKGTLAKKWDWRNVNGKDLTTAVMNQHIPKYCGACWAFGTLSALSDRVKIARDGAWPEVQLSPQMLLNCGEKYGYSVGCNGGYAHATYAIAHREGVTDITCTNYEAQDGKCDGEGVCKNCAHDGSCMAVKNPTRYFVKEYGQVRGEGPIMSEIQERGPVACGVAVTKDLFKYNGGIFHDKTGEKQIRHVISLVGWGKENGKKYWVARNSWGSYWGENGYFRIVRGKNNLNIESDCYWAVPKFDHPSVTSLAKGKAEMTKTTERFAVAEDLENKAAAAQATSDVESADRDILGNMDAMAVEDSEEDKQENEDDMEEGEINSDDDVDDEINFNDVEDFDA